MKKFSVGYEGWFIIEANTMDEALDEANELLSESNLINDGELGEWYLGDADEEEDE